MNKLNLPWRAENGCVHNCRDEVIFAGVVGAVLRNDPDEDRITAEYIAAHARPLDGAEVAITVRGFDMKAYVARYDAEDGYLELSALLSHGHDLLPTWDLLDLHLRKDIELAVARRLS